MQLFVCEFEIKKDKIIIEDINILYQLRKVLRSKIGDNIFVQKKGNVDIRYELKIDDRDDKKLTGNIVNIIKNQNLNKFCGMIVSMPNKWDKAEMIVQKLTEIGINSIIFWPAERSVIKEINLNKIERFDKIIKEALEQSWGWNLPKIEFVYDLKDIVENSKLIVFDKKLVESKNVKSKDDQLKIYGLVGPEGGLTDNDYKRFGNNFEVRCLGETVFRTETAAIIGGWEIIKLK